MPYIQIKAYPKDEEIKNRVAQRINQVFLEEWGCPPGAISISFEEINPALWVETVEQKEMQEKEAFMKIYKGEKRY